MTRFSSLNAFTVPHPEFGDSYPKFVAAVLKEMIRRGRPEADARALGKERDADFQRCFRNQMSAADAIDAVIGNEEAGDVSR